MRSHLIFAFAFSTSVFCADPLKVSDLRLSVAAGKMNNYNSAYSYTEGSNSYYSSGRATSNEAPQTLRVFRLIYTRGLIKDKGGLLFGVGFQHFSSSETYDGEKFDSNATGLQGKVAYGMRLGDNAHFELGPFVGAGLIEVEDADITSGLQVDRATGDGTFMQLGMEAGAYVALMQHLVLGMFVSVDYTFANWDARFPKTGGTYSASADWSAVLGGVSMGFRF